MSGGHSWRFDCIIDNNLMKKRKIIFNELRSEVTAMIFFYLIIIIFDKNTTNKIINTINIVN